MGFSSSHSISLAGKFLLRLLAYSDGRQVNYSALYNGQESMRILLAHCICHDLNEINDFVAHGRSYLDHAIEQLERARYLTRNWLRTKLVDGYPDYRIELTQDGYEFFLSGKKLNYYPSDCW